MAKGVYKRGRVYWVRYAGLDGRTVYESSGSTKQKDAETLYRQRKQSIDEGKQPEVKRIANYTFRELAVQYSEWMKGRHRSEKVKKYIIAGLVVRFGSIPLRRFNTPIIEQLQTELMNKGHKNSYVNKVLNVFKAMLTKATEWEMLETEVLKRVRRVKGLEENKRLRYLSIEECQTLINACDAHLRPIVLTALLTGMRRGEILNLRRENLDLTHGFILLDRSKNGERREVPINEMLMETLRALPRRLDTNYVFPNPKTGKAYGDIKHSFSSTCKKIGLHDLHFHDLRHTFASQLVMKGVDLTTVKELLGHKDIKMTLRYAHLAPAHKMKAVNILDDAFNANYTKTIQTVG